MQDKQYILVKFTQTQIGKILAFLLFLIFRKDMKKISNNGQLLSISYLC